VKLCVERCGRRRYSAAPQCKRCRECSKVRILVCHREYARRLYKTDRDRCLATQKRYAMRHHANVLERSRAWRKANVARRKEYQKKYYEKNADLLRAYSREWSKRNPERHRARIKAWFKTNRARARELALRWYHSHKRLPMFDRYRLRLRDAQWLRCVRKRYGGMPAPEILELLVLIRAVRQKIRAERKAYACAK
jgi:hypothetical protein